MNSNNYDPIKTDLDALSAVELEELASILVPSDASYLLDPNAL